MNEPKFTPGPWKAERFRPCGGSPSRETFASRVIIGRTSFTVAHHEINYKTIITPLPALGPYAINERRDEGTGVPDKNEAMCVNGIHPDAHLIAASPDLYHALKNLLAALDALPVKPASVPLFEAAQDSRAALAKARGEGQS